MRRDGFADCSSCLSEAASGPGARRLNDAVDVLLYRGLDPARIPNFAKMKGYLEAGDFRSADARKVGPNLFRARLDRANRLLFSFARCGGRTYVLVLEFIANHAYDRSRFLAGGARIDEAKLPELPGEAPRQAQELAYVNPQRRSFNLLDKVICFDEAQDEAFSLAPPMMVIGSAGSGKTVLTLEKMKQARGRVLYVTRSRYLAERSREAYRGLNYDNGDQDAAFLSYREFIESIRVPDTREMTFAQFARWFDRHRRTSGLKDAHRLFEEFNGVIAGSTADEPYLSREAYVSLGVRRSIYPREKRVRVHELFMKYLAHLAEQARHDPNLLAHAYRGIVQPVWDFAVVDEVQDLTNVQLELVLRSLKDARGFILCGDANQIVHPNFFSWSGLKSHFHTRGRHTRSKRRAADPIRVLTANYRNARQVTELANRILRLKHARFGSVDRESTRLVSSRSHKDGEVRLLPEEPDTVRELDGKTRGSTRCAVIVMHARDKGAARRRFRTPLVFSIREAKGLEYDSVILYGFVSGEAKRYREIARGVNAGEVQGGTPAFARSRDKSDKSLEIYKFHVNALYVAVTRAVRNVYLVEPAPKQRVFELLGVRPFAGRLRVQKEASSLDEWRREANRLESQGRQEQAEAIRTRVLGVAPTPWQPLERPAVRRLSERAFEGAAGKSRLALFEYALLSRDEARIERLAQAGFRPARRALEASLRQLKSKHFSAYTFRKPDGVLALVERYGLEHRDRFNFTPLMLAARFGHEAAAARLVEMGAKTDPVNSAGLTAFQILLREASLDTRYAQRSVAGLWDRLRPSHVTVIAGGRVVQIDRRKGEFLLFNLFVALFHTATRANAKWRALGLAAGDVADVLEALPASAVPEYRTRRRYVSQMLARNEVAGKSRWNRRIFRRTIRGYYVLNPDMRVRVGEDWVAMYELLEPETLLAERAWDVPEEFRDVYRREVGRFHREIVGFLTGDEPGRKAGGSGGDPGGLAE